MRRGLHKGFGERSMGSDYPQPKAASHHYRLRAFTLVEMVVTMGIVGLLMVGLGSAILIATKAIPDQNRTTSRLIQTSLTAEDLVTELQQAIYVTERTAHAITFTVADYDSDSDESPERIRYSWSGTAGDPLMRQFNDGDEIPVLENVQQFNLTYDLTSVSETYPGPNIESSERIFNSYDFAKSIKDYRIEHNHWMGQYFKPDPAIFPADTLAWKVTRVRFIAMREGSTLEPIHVELRTPDINHWPTDTILEQQILHESALSWSYQWQDVSFSHVTGLAPDDDLCLVIKQPNVSDHACRVLFEDGSDFGATGRLKTGNAGDSWEYKTDKAMKYYIYGTYSTPGADQTVIRQYVTAINLVLQAGDDISARIDTNLRMLNTPEALSAVWETDFNTDPTAYDMNGDLLGDWVVHDGGTFIPAELSGSIWHTIDKTIDTYPHNDFNELTTAELRFRNTTIGGNGAVFQINADWVESRYAVIYAYLQLQPDNTQRLTVYDKKDNSTPIQLITVSGLSSDFVTLRLLIDPKLDTVHVKVNGENKGTYHYHTFLPVSEDRFASVLSWGSEAEFDYVSIKVGGISP